MQDSESVQFKLDLYLLIFDSNIKHETYDEEWFYGIIFHVDGFRYDVMHNYALGNRLLINNKDGWSKDIPFKEATFGFLPAGVQVRLL